MHGAGARLQGEEGVYGEIPAPQDPCTTGVAVSSKGLVRMASEKR
jgi:hypothetical protein